MSDYFAETEQVAFCTAHLVADQFTDDPLLQAHSYFDTQITRLGVPNFEFLPINRTWSVNPMMQDGFGQSAILAGRTRYSPNSLGGGCPYHVDGRGLRAGRPPSPAPLGVAEQTLSRTTSRRPPCSGTA